MQQANHTHTFHLQMINAYQRENQLYCVRAEYIPNDPNNLNVSTSPCSEMVLQRACHIHSRQPLGLPGCVSTQRKPVCLVVQPLNNPNSSTCTQLTMTMLEPWTLTDTLRLNFCLQKGLQVMNSAREGGVNGPLVGSTGSGASSSSNSIFGGSFGLSAFPATQLAADGSSSSRTGASKLNVGPSFLASLYNAGFKSTFGPYWVVAVGECCLLNAPVQPARHNPCMQP